MIAHKLFQMLKSPAIRDSWIARNRILQKVFAVYLRLYNALVVKTGILDKKIAGSIGEGTAIDPSAMIDFKNAVIGKSCHIGSHVIMGKSTLVGNNVIIGPGTVIGSEGFEIRRIGNELIPVAHAGGVKIHDNIIIGSHTCIDRSLFGEFTEISENSLIGDNVHVAHGVKIGKRCLIAASVMIGGKVTIGDDVRIGPGAKLSDQLTIGNGAIISTGSVVTKDVPSGQRVTGNFAISHEKFQKHLQEIS